MPDTEISRLEELPSGLVEARDVLAIVDTSASETKKVSSVDLVQRGVELLPDGSSGGRSKRGEQSRQQSWRLQQRGSSLWIGRKRWRKRRGRQR